MLGQNLIKVTTVLGVNGTNPGIELEPVSEVEEKIEEITTTSLPESSAAATGNNCHSIWH